MTRSLLACIPQPIRCTSGQREYARRSARTLRAHVAGQVAGGPLADTQDFRRMNYCCGTFVCSTFSQNARRSRQPAPSFSCSFKHGNTPARPPRRVRPTCPPCAQTFEARSSKPASRTPWHRSWPNPSRRAPQDNPAERSPLCNGLTTPGRSPRAMRQPS